MPKDMEGIHSVASGDQCVQTWSRKLTSSGNWHLFDDDRQAPPNWKEVCGRSAMSGWTNSTSMSRFQSFAKEFRLTDSADIAKVLGPDAFDVCLDHLGGPVLTGLLGAAAPGARIVQIGRLAWAHAHLDLGMLASRRIQLIGTTFRGREADELHTLAARLCEVLPGLLRIHNCVLSSARASSSARQNVRGNSSTGPDSPAR
jgi:hypothetical protein